MTDGSYGAIRVQRIPMLSPVLPLFRIRRERHTAFALRSNSPDFEMTSLICSRGGLAAAAVAVSMAASRAGGRIGEAAEAPLRRRSAKGCR